MKNIAKNTSTKHVGNTTYSETEMKRYLGALTETHNEHLKAIKENSILTNSRLDKMDGRLDKMDDHFGNIEQKLDSHTEMIGILSESVSKLESDMVVVKEDLSFIKGDLKKKVDYEDFLSLVRRVQKIEAKI